MPIGPYSKYTRTYWDNNEIRTEKWQWSWRTPTLERHPHRVRPGLAPLRYEQHFTESKTEGVSANQIHAGYYAIVGRPTQWEGVCDDVHNRCFEKLIAKTQSAAAQIGADLGERRKTVDLMVRRAQQLYNAARALKQRKWKKFLKYLELPFNWVRPRSNAKTLADLWLEYHFGWEPLVEDIYNCWMVLQSPVPSLIKVRVRAQARPEPIRLESDESPVWGDVLLIHGTMREQMGARITVSNPNLWKARNLGLTNPVSIAWELVQFSFVVDWFATVSLVIDSWDAFLGLEVVEPYTTQTRFYKSEYRSFERWSDATISAYKGIGMSFVRETTIERPILKIRSWKHPSLARAATVFSLLTQLLDKFTTERTNGWRFV